MTTGTKTIGNSSPSVPGYYYRRQWGGGDSPVLVKVTNVRRKYYKRGFLRSDWVRSVKRARGRSENNYTMTLEEWTQKSLSTTGSRTVRAAFGSSALGPCNSDGNYPPWDSNDEIALLGRLRSEVAGSDFNLGVTLGESHQTLKFIGDSALRVAKSLKFVKRGNFAAAYSALSGNQHLPGTKRVASNYLEYTYALTPLLLDVHSGAQFLAHHLNTPQHIVVRVSQSRRYYVEQSPGYTGAYPMRSWKSSCKSIKAILREKDVAQLAGLTDPASIAWELMPWSFVVDWFVPIGDYLQARALVNGIRGTFVTSYKSVVGAEDYSHQPPRYRDPTYRYYKVSNTRVVSTTLSVPLPKVKPFSSALSWKHCANAIALLRSVL